MIVEGVLCACCHRVGELNEAGLKETLQHGNGHENGVNGIEKATLLSEHFSANNGASTKTLALSNSEEGQAADECKYRF